MQDRMLYALEINKMIIRNDLRKAAEKKLIEIKEAVSEFDKYFDKMTRVGLPSCWGAKGNLLPWSSYENLLVMTKINIDNRHEKTQVLKGEMMVNYLQRNCEILWMVKTLFSERPYYDRITAFRLEYHNLTHSSKTKVEIWKKFRSWTIDLPKGSATKKDK